MHRVIQRKNVSPDITPLIRIYYNTQFRIDRDTIYL